MVRYSSYHLQKEYSCKIRPSNCEEEQPHSSLRAILNTHQSKCESVQLPSLPEGSFALQLSRTGSLLQIHSLGQYREVLETVTVIMEQADSGTWRQVEGDS